MADAQLPGNGNPAAGQPISEVPNAPPEQFAGHPQMNPAHGQLAPANPPAQEPNNAAAPGAALALAPAHQPPQDVFAPLLKSLQGRFPPG
ncbi:hypothetical protein FRC11_007856 [Ceratobasidium sp. 423]|nr:hypothetical protein FRC11_007856 [Ceratobasidium sp. 423]